MRRHPRLSCAALSLLLLAAACASEEPPRARGAFVLISLDTLRADHLGTYGYKRPTSPFLDQLASRSVVFENAIVQLPGTLPSHTSMLTGLYPWQHGVLPPDGFIPPDVVTVAQVMQVAGFETAAFTEGGYVSPEYGFGRGFDTFVTEKAVLDVDGRYRRIPDGPRRVFHHALAALRKLQPDQPAFVFVHTYATHDPYDPPAEYARRFWAGPPRQALPPTGDDLNAHNLGRRPVSPELAEYYQALYDAQIAYVDGVLQEFFAGLAQLGREDLTVIITSDHGEEFLEHGGLGHEQVYHQTLHVPLLLVPGSGLELGAARVSCLVESVDLMPTLLDLAGIPLEKRPQTPGRSLMPLAAGRPCPGRQEAFAAGFDWRTWSIHHRDAAGYWEYVISEPPDGWARRSLLIQAEPPSLAFHIATFAKPRRVSLAIDGAPQRAFEVTPAGEEIVVALPPGRSSHAVVLEADGCDSPADQQPGGDARCLSFRVTGVSLQRRALFALGSREGAARDVLPGHLRLGERLEARLEQLRGSTPRPTVRKELSPQLREQLRALGYVR